MSNNSIKDRQLVDGLVKGDITCFDELFKNYSDSLFAFSMNYLKSDVEAEEIVQEVFIKIWENRHQLKSELSFRSFIFKIAYNSILKNFRAKAYHKSFVQEQIVREDLNYSDEKRLEYKSVLDQIYNLLEQLPDKKRNIFIKSRIDGQPSTEIAKELNIAKSTVDNNISEVLKFLKSKSDQLSLGVMLFIYLFF